MIKMFQSAYIKYFDITSEKGEGSIYCLEETITYYFHDRISPDKLISLEMELICSAVMTS